MLCTCTNCVSNGALRLKEALEAEIAKHDLENDVQVVPTGASGLCVKGPILIVQPEGIFYQLLTEEDVPHLVEEHFLKGRPVRSLMYVAPGEEAPIPRVRDIPFFRKQRLVALRNRGLIDPDKIEEYIARDGYKALAKVLTSMTPEEVIREVKDSGLRGRGGAGFPTGQKWEFCRRSVETPKYIICNADEGDPGAFMDRSIIEADPHSVLEGMAIGAYAMGGTHGYIYVRMEYPLAIARMTTAIEQAREYGLLGEDILGRGFSFDVEVFRGAGAFVCGEETSLIASLEGRPPEPSMRPPFPAESGLWGKPTNINNVETWANVPVIISWGAKWFAEIGTETSKGTKVFSLAGNVNNAGLVEVPMGITLQEIVYDIGGGIPKGKQLKAVQTGGPSGGFIPRKLLDLPVDYDRLQEAGAIMGSGGMVVVDENACMVDMAKYFLEFTRSESCGRCSACREGLEIMYQILTDISEGKGKEEDIPLLEELSQAVKDGSMCALGGTAPNPVLTSIRHFREEYEEHIYQKHCRAAVCRGLVRSPCSHTCPAGVEAHRYVRAISQGRFDEAYLVIREKMPLPSICGLVCFHPCEARCRRGLLEQPIAVRALKRAAMKYGSRAEPEKPALASPSGKKVAVVGSGPAGLTAAYYLAKLGGHEVAIFEALPKAGGMLRMGIPRYRLPEEDVERDIDIVRRVGVKIKTDSKVESVAELKKSGFDAVFLSPGAHLGLALGVEGQECAGVVDCVEFLRGVSLGEKVAIGKRVAVVGGGNSAIDAARTALRLGAEQVTILYRRSRDEMPADAQEIADALEEGIRLEILTLPINIQRNGGGLQVTCQRMQLGEYDESGRRRPVPIPDSEFTSEYDTVIPAIGQQPDIPPGLGVEVGRGQRIKVDGDTLQTSLEGVFAGGDVVSGPASVVEAIAHGRRAAMSIDRYLGGSGKIDEQLAPPEQLEELPPLPVETEDRYRPEMPYHSVQKRVKDFVQMELGYSREAALEEASRCLRCDLEE